MTDTPPRTRFIVADDQLLLRCDHRPRLDDRPFTDQDIETLRELLAGYHPKTPDNHLALGQSLYRWLDGPAQWMRDIRPTRQPWIVEFQIADYDETERELLFFHLPWELLANDDRFLAHDTRLGYCPVRRIGEPRAPAAPSDCRLSLLFMAASPIGVSELNYEDEESAIMNATMPSETTPYADLFVEESGHPAGMGESYNALEPDVLHLSCHGEIGDQAPLLAMETDNGRQQDVSPRQLADHLCSKPPQLLFLSACYTAHPGNQLTDSYALRMIQHNVPAVIGWSGAVYDHEATRFASKLYEQLSYKCSLETAMTRARSQLLDPQPGRDWHLARLILGPGGGGQLTANNQRSRHDYRADAATKAFLDKHNDDIPVASHHEFTGRRRQLQNIQAAWKNPQYAGVILTGAGRRGKSSVAARFSQRLQTHHTVVIYKDYRAETILNRIAQIDITSCRDVRERYLPQLHNRPELLEDALQILLNDVFNAEGNGKRSLLLIIDDLEQILTEPSSSPTMVRNDKHRLALLATINAFHHHRKSSRLLITSRYNFRLIDHGEDRTALLHHEHLPPMSPVEQRKQALRQSRLLGGRLRHTLHTALIRSAEGNPGLQNLLFRLAIADPASGQQLVEQIDTWLADRTTPNQEELRQFVKNLALEALMTAAEQLDSGTALLRAATLFDIPVPHAVITALQHTLGIDAATSSQLVDLGLMDRYPDPSGEHFMLNPLTRHRLTPLSNRERTLLATAALPPLWDAWQAQRNGPQDLQLTRLALADPQPPILLACAEGALWHLGEFDYRGAGQLAQTLLPHLAPTHPPLRLQTRLAEALQNGGHTRQAEQIFETAVAQHSETAGAQSDYASLLLSYSRLLKNKGAPDQALSLLNEARNQFETLRQPRDRTITLGDIARIKVDKGQVDDALKLHQEMIDVFEALGDQRERAVTLGDIARIKVSKGQVDDALKLHYERLDVFEALGDQRSRAATLNDLGNIALQQQQWEKAFEYFAQAYPVVMQLGDLQGIIHVGQPLGQLLCASGHHEQGLEILERSLAGLKHLGQTQHAVQLQAIIDQIKPT